MYFVDSGTGAPVVLIHGLFGDSDNLKSLGNELLAGGYRVIRIDCPNHGNSEPLAAMTYPEVARQLLAVLDSLALPKVQLVGHSMGGKVAMALALLYPERVSALVAADIAPVAYQPRHQQIFAAMVGLPPHTKDRREALQYLTHAGVDEATAQFLLKSLRRDDHDGWCWKLHLTELLNSYPEIIGWFNPDSHGQLQRYEGPILFLHSADPAYVNASYRDTILAQFPNAQSKMIEGTGHWLHAQKPAIFNRIVRDFIDQHATPSSV